MMEAIVLAGGLGTRIRAVVQHVPKPMALIHGRPFLEYLLEYWQGQGIKRFILSVGYQHEVIQAHFGKHFGKAEIEYSVERKPLGTGGGLLAAMHYLKTTRNFLVLNGDTFFEVSLGDLKKQHEFNKADLTLALAACLSEDRYERPQLDRHGQVHGLEVRGAAGASSRWINGGVYLVKPKCLKAFRSDAVKKLSFENEILPILIKSGAKVFGFKSKGRFIDIGTPASYRASKKILKEIK